MTVEFNVGDQLLITTKGTVDRVLTPSPTGARRYQLRDAGGKLRYLTVPGGDPGVTIEVTERASGVVDGGVYIDADSDIFRYNAAERSWFEFDKHSGSYDTLSSRFNYPRRPLTRLDK